MKPRYKNHLFATMMMMTMTTTMMMMMTVYQSCLVFCLQTTTFDGKSVVQKLNKV
jgi:hypothetical protein